MLANVSIREHANVVLCALTLIRALGVRDINFCMYCLFAICKKNSRRKQLNLFWLVQNSSALPLYQTVSCTEA